MLQKKNRFVHICTIYFGLKNKFYINLLCTNRFKPDWEAAAEVPGDQLDARVPDLKEQAEYQFRVVAVNKAGPSEPSDATKGHIVKHKACK